MQLTLSLTHDCNLACSYCYAGTKRKCSMDFSTAKAAVDLSLSHHPNELHLGFFGGEPLLEWPLLTNITRYTRDKCSFESIPVVFTVTTNGTLLTMERMVMLHENDFFVSVSLDGNQKMHDTHRHFQKNGSSFDNCLKGLRTALYVDATSEVICVITPENVPHLSESIQFLFNECGVCRLTLNPDFSSPWNADSLKNLSQQMSSVAVFYIKSYRMGSPLYLNLIDNKIIARIKGGLTCEDHCNFGRGEIAVAPSGRIYPCERLIGDDKNHELCIGTVDEGVDNEKLQQLHSNNRSANECSNCSILNICQNSCGCTNYLLTGNHSTPDGLVCSFEQLSVNIADSVATQLFREGNPSFLERFYLETELS